MIKKGNKIHPGLRRPPIDNGTHNNQPTTGGYGEEKRTEMRCYAKGWTAWGEWDGKLFEIQKKMKTISL